MKRVLVALIACLCAPVFGEEAVFRAGSVSVTCVDRSTDRDRVVACSVAEYEGDSAEWELMRGTRKRLDKATGWRYEAKLGEPGETITLWLFVWRSAGAEVAGQLQLELCWSGEQLLVKKGQQIVALGAVEPPDVGQCFLE